MSKSILVPHDFTEVGDFALEHAYIISKASKSSIHVIHVVRKSREVDEAKQKLEQIVNNFKQGKEIDIITKVSVGRLHKEVYNYGLEIDASLGVMGTHGVKTIKKALKIVKQFVKIPFILVQNHVVHGDYDRILIPIDSDITSRIKIQWVRYINTLFESKAYLIAHQVTDGFKIKALNNNLKFAQDWFERELMDYELNILPSGKYFADEIFTYANEVESDLILIMADKYKSYIKSLKRVENLELYSRIPIMCVNKRADLYKTGGFN